MLRVLSDEEIEKAWRIHDEDGISIRDAERHVAQAQVQQDRDEIKRVIAQKMLDNPDNKEYYLDIYHTLTKEQGGTR